MLAGRLRVSREVGALHRQHGVDLLKIGSDARPDRTGIVGAVRARVAVRNTPCLACQVEGEQPQVEADSRPIERDALFIRRV